MFLTELLTIPPQDLRPLLPEQLDLHSSIGGSAALHRVPCSPTEGPALLLQKSLSISARQSTTCREAAISVMNIHERTRLLGSSAPGTRLRVHFARLFQEDNQVALLEDQIILSVPAPWTSWQTSHGSARLAKVLSAIEFVPNFQRRPVCQRGLTGLQLLAWKRIVSLEKETLGISQICESTSVLPVMAPWKKCKNVLG